MKEKNIFTVAIAGGSGSGKTTIINALVNKYLEKKEVTILTQDHYYKDLSHLTEDERALVNFDTPESLDKDLFISHIKDLSSGKSIMRPCYDFTTHQRTSVFEKVTPGRIIIVDGIFSLFFEQIHPLLDLKIFLQVSDDLRFIRRIQRDIEHRGRSMESVIKQYLATVRPMHEKFVKPCINIADFVIQWDQYNEYAIRSLARSLAAHIS